MKSILMAGFVLVVLLASVGVVSANLVTNGGFETPVAAHPWTTLFTGNGLTGWTITSGSIDLINGYWQPHLGSQSIDLSGNSPGMISQNISTVAGGKYDLTFWMAGNPDIQEVKTLGVFWDGVELSPTYTFDSTGHSYTNMGWKEVTIPGLQATGTSTEIGFLDIQAQNDPCGVTLDDISVVPSQTNPAPEFPGIAAPVISLVGLLGAIFYVRRMK
ncbi:MAG: choice-of-anchor C family protein [Methanoregula sp.]|uniref:choice-of-anchor C family protein n=1 Tax=Methanoregula sp. TaxID=2052170 RepID=UPI003BAF4D46